MPTYRLKYLPKKEMLAKFSESEMACMVRLVDFNCDFASIITIEAMTSAHVFPVICLTTAQRCACVMSNFLAYQPTFRV